MVVLVDEYGKPILDVLQDPDLATANRDYLRRFQGIIKDCAEHVRFVFVTGVSMFSKDSLFSGLKNPRDISCDPGKIEPDQEVTGYAPVDAEPTFRIFSLALTKETSAHLVSEILVADDNMLAREAVTSK